MAKTPPAEKPKLITLRKITRTRRFITIKFNHGDDAESLQCPDIPLPAFSTALDNLHDLVATVLHVPGEYCEVDMKVVGLVLSTKGGARSVSVIAQKSLDDASKAFLIVTPERLLEHPTQPGSYTPALSQDFIEKVEEVIAQAKAYLEGDRDRGQLPLEEDKDEDDENVEQGEFAGAGTKK